MEKMTISSLLLTTQASHHDTTARSSHPINRRISHRIHHSTHSQMEQTNQPHGRCRRSAGVPVSRPPGSRPAPHPTTATRGGDDHRRASERAAPWRPGRRGRRRGETPRARSTNKEKEKKPAGEESMQTFRSACARVATHGASSRGRRRTRRYGLRRHRDQR